MNPEQRVEEPRPGQLWRRRPLLSGLLRAAIFVLPVAASLAASMLLIKVLPRPEGALRIGLWWTVVVAGSLVALIGVGRLARRLIPLATLLNLSLLFPDRAPARFAVARRVGRPEELRQKLLRAHEDGLEDDAFGARTVLELVTALQLHDRQTRGHSERTRVFTDLISEEMQLPELDRARLRWASLLHDIGKLDVPADILTKAAAPDDEEWATLHAHPEQGAKLVAPIFPWLGEWAFAVEHHHERFDGSGYPRGLRGEEISLGGRIVAVADSYETMTAPRPYRRPMGATAARGELVRCSGTHFDPAVVRAFLNISVGRIWRAAGFGAWLGQFPLLGRLGGGFGQIGSQIASGVAVTATTAGLVVGGVLGPHHSAAASAPATAAAHTKPVPPGRSASLIPGATATPSPNPQPASTPAASAGSPVPSAVRLQPNPTATATPAASAAAQPTSTGPASPSPTPTARVDTPPTVTVNAAAQVSEGTSFSGGGSFSDPDSSSWTATVDYGDGSGTHPLALAGRSFTLGHTYANEGTFAVTVTVTDDGSASGRGSTSLRVVDVAPVVQAIPTATLAGSGTKTYSQPGSFSDPASDTWTATVDYGDGAGPQPLALTGRTFTLNHQYAQGHTYTVTVVISDDDGSSGTASTTVKA
ncbi:MAG: HD domain-containing protein [Chloroflexi bacterium]|nr:MAG: HD domain-containing protein [Chloroflexota bacterium]